MEVRKKRQKNPGIQSFAQKVERGVREAVSEPEANWGPQAGSPLGVGVATGSRLIGKAEGFIVNHRPVLIYSASPAFCATRIRPHPVTL